MSTWTVEEACAEFAAAGVPIEPARFLMAIHAIRLRPVGEIRKPHGSKGGRGRNLYDIADLQRLHAALAPWLTAQEPP